MRGRTEESNGAKLATWLGLGLETACEAGLTGRDWPKLTEVGLSAEDNNNTRVTCECFR